ncbi:expressed unknown protein [Seminavis robusta]|uniref:Uncharacterized protein n=1 Tax=Seminavis robusta TaxID=568900 RepID=A0A9N8E969_9STRA|nr:expressed unknown protein [Seminavis robusta]|eukprot:Sro811_g205930.1 n/a (294) ;mRNA; f:30614-31495
MVVIDNYSVRLVHAETKEPFKEHSGPDGKVYTEVEPDVEYFIQVAVVGTMDEVFLFDYFVDGQELSYNTACELGDGYQYCGILSIEKGISKMQALCFRRPPRNLLIQNQDTNDDTTHAWMGEIQVDVSKAMEGEMLPIEQVPADTVDVEAVDAGGITENKVLRSGQGSYSHVQEAPSEAPHYGTGEFLQTITIHYCTAVGLIHVGVLPKPDLWTFARMNKPYDNKRTNDNTLLYNNTIQPKRIKSGGLVDGDSVLEEPKEYDLFDLTELPDDDDDDSNQEADGNVPFPVTPPH